MPCSEGLRFWYPTKPPNKYVTSNEILTLPTASANLGENMSKLELIPFDPKFNPVSGLMRLTTRLIPWIEAQLYHSMKRPKRPNKKETTILIRYEDYSAWLEAIIFRIEICPCQYIRILEGAVVHNPGKHRDRDSIYSRHFSQSYMSVVRTIIYELIEATSEDWIADCATASQHKKNLENLLKRFPQRRIIQG